MLRFIDFLRAAVNKAIDNGDFENMSFAQRKMFVTNLFNFLQLARSRDYRAISML